MLTRLKYVLAALALAFSFAGAAPAYAQSDQDAALRALRSGQIMSYSDIRRIAEQRFGGNVIGQDPPRRLGGDRWVYDLRVLTPRGEVVDVRMDARNGRVLKRRGKP